MQRILITMFALTLSVTSLSDAHAQQRQRNQGLPKVDFQIVQIQKVGQAVAVSVKNGGFERSPATSVRITIYDGQNRQLLTTQTLSTAPLQPNQTRRVLMVPPNTGRPIMVRAKVDPGNRVQETNERNNETASRL